jgi:predicted RNase H-like nuclease (RuvC/YqgF family)
MDVGELLNTVESKAKSSPKKKKEKREDKSFDNVMNSISQNWEKTPESSDLERLKKELEEAKKKIQTLESTTASLSKNEEKIISAIRSEAIEQDTDKPIISYNKYRKKYKVSSDFYRRSINALLDKGIIRQEEATYSGNVKTYRWKIIQ